MLQMRVNLFRSIRFNILHLPLSVPLHLLLHYLCASIQATQRSRIVREDGNGLSNRTILLSSMGIPIIPGKVGHGLHANLTVRKSILLNAWMLIFLYRFFRFCLWIRDQCLSELFYWWQARDFFAFEEFFIYERNVIRSWGVVFPGTQDQCSIWWRRLAEPFFLLLINSAIFTSPAQFFVFHSRGWRYGARPHFASSKHQESFYGYTSTLKYSEKHWIYFFGSPAKICL